MNETEHFDLVSVVVAAKNEAKHVEEAITSIVTQQGIAVEVVFVDDHSEDTTLDIVSSLAHRFSCLRVLRNPKRGKCSAFNHGVSQARGRFVCIFAGDDIMPAGSLARRYNAISQTSDDRPTVGLAKLVTMSEDKRYDGHIVPRAPGRGATSGVSPLMNRKALELIFPTPEHLPNEDTWMELAVLHMPGWEIVHSDIICCQWRVHAGNSINYSVPFDVFNRKITVRMDALSLFMDKYGDTLSDAHKALLQSKIDLEKARRNGRWWTVLNTKSPLIDRLRALSITNLYMYAIRRRLYGLLSGW